MASSASSAIIVQGNKRRGPALEEPQPATKKVRESEAGLLASPEKACNGQETDDSLAKKDLGKLAYAHYNLMRAKLEDTEGLLILVKLEMDVEFEKRKTVQFVEEERRKTATLVEEEKRKTAALVEAEKRATLFAERAAAADHMRLEEQRRERLRLEREVVDLKIRFAA